MPYVQTRGSGDYTGMVMDSVPLEACPPGWYFVAETQRCYPCPKSAARPTRQALQEDDERLDGLLS